MTKRIMDMTDAELLEEAVKRVLGRSPTRISTARAWALKGIDYAKERARLLGFEPLFFRDVRAEFNYLHNLQQGATMLRRQTPCVPEPTLAEKMAVHIGCDP